VTDAKGTGVQLRSGFWLNFKQAMLVSQSSLLRDPDAADLAHYTTSARHRPVGRRGGLAQLLRLRGLRRRLAWWTSCGRSRTSQ
jgi:hypothetical protein